jgi:predicted phosphodiesterase
VVAGNCDAHPWPLTLDLERAGLRFHLEHIPPRNPPRAAQVILHGHTHVPRDETDPLGVRWLNPGCITRPNRGAPASFAWLRLERGRPLRWDLVLL